MGGSDFAPLLGADAGGSSFALSSVGVGFSVGSAAGLTGGVEPLLATRIAAGSGCSAREAGGRMSSGFRAEAVVTG